MAGAREDELSATLPGGGPDTQPLEGRREAAKGAAFEGARAEHLTVGSELARGGMGRVLFAQDRRLHRRVAVKQLLRTDDAAQARFQREALITARLQHPGVVPIYESGLLPSGEPFYAMRLVAGRSLEHVLAATRGLDERLALLPSLIAVAETLAYAHSQGVIHRDLKPDNILLGDFGEALVIDWGLAKDLDDPETQQGNDDPATSSDRTVAGAILGTPAFMPPEQALGQPADERSDVWSLGAILYTVLSGERPYGGKSTQEILENVRRAPPAPLATREPGVPRALAGIVDKAMAREAAARYPSALELARDLERFQAGQLVAAHRYSRGELILAWVRRHRAAVAVGAAALVSLAVVSTLALARIFAARAEAERQAEKVAVERAGALKLVDFMLDRLRGRLDTDPAALEAIANAAGEYYLATETPNDVVGLSARARTLDVVGDVHYGRGDNPGARISFAAALAMQERVIAARPDDFAARLLETQLVQRIADCDADADSKGALRGYWHSLGLREALRRQRPRDPDVLRALAVNHRQMGRVQGSRRELDDALRSYWAAVTLARELRAVRPDNDAHMQLALAYLRVGQVLVDRKRWDDAEKALTIAHDELDRLRREGPDDLEVWRHLAFAGDELGKVAMGRRDYVTALDRFTRAVELQRRVTVATPEMLQYKRDLSVLLNHVGDTHLAAGRIAEAREAFRAVLTIRTELGARNLTNLLRQRDIAISHDRLAEVALKSGDAAGALEEYRASLEIARRLAAGDPHSGMFQADLAESLLNLGTTLAQLGRKDEAARALEEAIADYKVVIVTQADEHDAMARAEAALAALR